MVVDVVEGEGVGGAGVVSLELLMLLLEEDEEEGEELELLASLVELVGASEVVLPPAGRARGAC